jgi:hypothetical protein
MKDLAPTFASQMATNDSHGTHTVVITELPAKGLGINCVIPYLQEQHMVDLQLYRSAHREWKNRMLHWYLIPVECWSALLFLWILVAVLTRHVTTLETFAVINQDTSDKVVSILRLVPKSATIVLGLISVAIATKAWIGLLTFLYHVGVLLSCETLMERYNEDDLWFVTAIAGAAWTLAWTVQVGVGHLMCEKNLPNVANMQKVSYLAMCQSVLIAWSS